MSLVYINIDTVIGARSKKQRTPVDDGQSPRGCAHGLDEELGIRVVQVADIHSTEPRHRSVVVRALDRSVLTGLSWSLRAATASTSPSTSPSSQRKEVWDL